MTHFVNSYNKENLIPWQWFPNNSIMRKATFIVMISDSLQNLRKNYLEIDF